MFWAEARDAVPRRRSKDNQTDAISLMCRINPIHSAAEERQRICLSTGHPRMADSCGFWHFVSCNRGTFGGKMEHSSKTLPNHDVSFPAVDPRRSATPSRQCRQQNREKPRVGLI